MAAAAWRNMRYSPPPPRAAINFLVVGTSALGNIIVSASQLWMLCKTRSCIPLSPKHPFPPPLYGTTQPTSEGVAALRKAMGVNMTLPHSIGEDHRVLVPIVNRHGCTVVQLCAWGARDCTSNV